MKELQEIIPIFGVEHDAILSKQGDITIAYEVTLPKLFMLSNQEYEALHQVLVKAIKILRMHTVFHKQDWFTVSLRPTTPLKFRLFFVAIRQKFCNTVDRMISDAVHFAYKAILHELLTLSATTIKKPCIIPTSSPAPTDSPYYQAPPARSC